MVLADRIDQVEMAQQMGRWHLEKKRLVKLVFLPLPTKGCGSGQILVESRTGIYSLSFRPRSEETSVADPDSLNPKTTAENH
jgi:hypothetical protein